MRGRSTRSSRSSGCRVCIRRRKWKAPRSAPTSLAEAITVTRPAIDRRRSDHVAIGAGAVEIGAPAKAGNGGHALGRPDHERTVGLDGRHDRKVDSQEALDAAPQLVARDAGGRGWSRGTRARSRRAGRSRAVPYHRRRGSGARGHSRSRPRAGPGRTSRRRQGERRFDCSSRQQQNISQSASSIRHTGVNLLFWSRIITSMPQQLTVECLLGMRA